MLYPNYSYTSHSATLTLCHFISSFLPGDPTDYELKQSLCIYHLNWYSESQFPMYVIWGIGGSLYTSPSNYWIPAGSQNSTQF